jgi:hypothetical protein
MMHSKPPRARSRIRTLCRTAVSAVVLVALAGCHNALTKRFFHAKECNKIQMYSSAQSVPPLKVPVGIDPPDTRSALRIPPLNEPAPPPRKLTDPCLDAPPLFAAPRPAVPATPAAKPLPSIS